MSFFWENLRKSLKKQNKHLAYGSSHLYGSVMTSSVNSSARTQKLKVLVRLYTPEVGSKIFSSLTMTEVGEYFAQADKGKIDAPSQTGSCPKPPQICTFSEIITGKSSMKNEKNNNKDFMVFVVIVGLFLCFFTFSWNRTPLLNVCFQVSSLLPPKIKVRKHF